MEEKKRGYTNPEVPVSRGSYVTGVIGAFLGVIVGTVPTICTVMLADRIFALLYALIPICGFFGYRLFKGPMNRWAIGITVIFSLLSVYWMMVVIQVLVPLGYGLSLSESLAVILPQLGSLNFWANMTANSASSFLFLLIGIFIAWSTMTKTVKNSSSR